VDKNEIKALFQLLDDPDNEVYEMVATKLQGCGKIIIPSLEHLWDTTIDEVAQTRIEDIIHKINLNDLKEEFLNWSNSSEPELFKGALLITKFTYNNFNLPFLLTQFEQIRKNIWLELNNYLTPIEKVNTFNGILYNYYKIKGTELSNYNLDAFYINHLLESKQGNAISIGILYIVLAEILDMPVYMMQIPNQFILGYVDSLQHFYATDATYVNKIAFYIDPVNGMIYSQHDLDVYLKKIGEDIQNPNFYKPLSNKGIIKKMIQELSKCMIHHGKNDYAYELKSFIQLL
jgi:regulator of sirC expression with transglutaminase-like and TPR domain